MTKAVGIIGEVYISTLIPKGEMLSSCKIISLAVMFEADVGCLTLSFGCSLPTDISSDLPWKAEAEMQRGGESHSTGEETNPNQIVLLHKTQKNYLGYGTSEVSHCVCACLYQEYLESIHGLYEDWLIKRTSVLLPAPVLVSSVLYIIQHVVIELCCTAATSCLLFLNVSYL